jgi:hypothetical protein
MVRGMTWDWVGRALALVCLGACGFRSMPRAIDDAGAVEDALGDDGSILIRLDAGGDGRIDGGNDDDDDDDDGRADADDNCPVTPNADQHDEDVDGAGDACDPCPQFANATRDGDSDGIADACDPHPDTPGDVLAKFEPFTGSGNLPPGWESRGAGMPTDWMHGNDVLRLVADNNTRVATFDAGASRHTIDVGVAVSMIGGGQSFVTVLADVKADIHQFFGCGLRFDNMMGGKSRELFVFDLDENPQFIGLKTDITDPPVAGVYRLQLVMDSNAESCTIPQAAAPHQQTAAVAARGHTFVALRARNVTLELRYVAIYKR